jgi:hypothetical protein
MPQLLAVNDTQIFKSVALYGAVDTGKSFWAPGRRDSGLS